MPIKYSTQVPAAATFRFKTGLLFIWLIYFLPVAAGCQSRLVPPDSLAPQRNLKFATAGLAVGYTGFLVVLSQTWYAQSERTPFHFFNDNRQWKQVDKVGHFYGAFQGGQLGIAALRAGKVPEKKAVIYGGLLGFVLQSPIELLDGYASEYGASVGDLSANAAGSVALIAQQLAWGEVKIMPKYSFNSSRYARVRPAVLGGNLPERLLKDYNGQTYWLSANISELLPAGSAYPKWLNLAFGYGAHRMVFGNPQENTRNGYDAYRQYYLALDVHLQNISTQHKFLQNLFKVISIIHLPAPTLEYNSYRGLIFHPVYF